MRDLYEQLGVREYFAFDWSGAYLDAPLYGFRLEDGQYQAILAEEDGSMESRFVGNVRPANAHEPMDEGWRPIDPTLDHFEAKGTDGPWPSDLTDLYWWRPTFWRRDGRES